MMSRNLIIQVTKSVLGGLLGLVAGLAIGTAVDKAVDAVANSTPRGYSLVKREVAP